MQVLIWQIFFVQRIFESLQVLQREILFQIRRWNHIFCIIKLKSAFSWCKYHPRPLCVLLPFILLSVTCPCWPSWDSPGPAPQTCHLQTCQECTQSHLSVSVMKILNSMGPSMDLFRDATEDELHPGSTGQDPTAWDHYFDYLN